MAYTMYLGGLAMPITPSKVEVKIKSQNKTLNLISGAEINILKEPGLTQVSFEVLLPNVPYPFARSQRAEQYLNKFEQLKTSKTPFQWILNRQLPNGKRLSCSNLTVAMEDYTIIDDAGAGFDMKVKISLKQYRGYGTKSVTITPPATPSAPATATVEPPARETASAPKTSSYTVKSGDCLWNIAKQYCGNGADYTKIYELNKDKIKNPNLIYPGQVLVLP